MDFDPWPYGCDAENLRRRMKLWPMVDVGFWLKPQVLKIREPLRHLSVDPAGPFSPPPIQPIRFEPTPQVFVRALLFDHYFCDAQHLSYFANNQHPNWSSRKASDLCFHLAVIDAWPSCPLNFSSFALCLATTLAWYFWSFGQVRHERT